MVDYTGLENQRTVTRSRGSNPFASAIKINPTTKETSVRQLHTKTEAEEVTVGNHKSIIKEWEAKTLLVELYGIVECKLLDINFIREQGERPR